MKRALAARANSDPNGLGIASSSPSQQPPMKLARIEEGAEEETQTTALSSTVMMLDNEERQSCSSSDVPEGAPPQVSNRINGLPTTLQPQPTPKIQIPAPVTTSSTDGEVGTPKLKQSMKRQRSSQTPSDDNEEGDHSAFFLKHQNAALSSELQQLRFQFKLLEKEREFRRKQCKAANSALQSLEATWGAMEVALQLGQQPDINDEQEAQEEETLGVKTISEETPRSTGTGESVELIGALLDSLAAIAKEPLQTDAVAVMEHPNTTSASQDDDNTAEVQNVQRLAESVSKRATALQRWIWGLLRKVMNGEEAGKPPLLKLAKLEAKTTALKSQIREFQNQIAELVKSRDDAVISERKVRRGLYRLNAGRMKLDEVMEAIETEDKDGSTALMVMEESAPPPSAPPTSNTDGEEVIDSAEVALLRKTVRDLEEISMSREKQIEDLAKQRDAHMKRINDLALRSDQERVARDKVFTEEDIKSSSLYSNTWTRMTTAERQLAEMQKKLDRLKGEWAASRGDAEHATRSLEEHLIKHKKRWVELTDTVENGGDYEVTISTEVRQQAAQIAELEHKLKQALENVRRADVVRSSLEDVSQLNEALQSRLDELKSRNQALLQHSKEVALKAENAAAAAASKKESNHESSSEPVSAERVEKLYRDNKRMKKDILLATTSKENAKAKLERCEKERDSLLKSNSRLAKQSAEKDEMNAKSLSTILHLKSVTEKLSEEKDLLDQQLKSAGQVNVAARLASNAKERVSDELSQQRKEFETKLASLESECEKLMVENEKAIASLSQKKAEMADLEKDAATAKERCDELVLESSKLQEEKRKLVESLAVAQREASESAKLISKMRSQSGDGGGNSDFTTDQLTTQISVLKGRLACPVCNHRDKSCIVIRCRHMFCKHCIDENVKNRNRKCPSCGQRFDTKDLEDIWL